MNLSDSRLLRSASLNGDEFPVIWIDNFSKNMARQIPSISKGVFTSMMWTGLAVKMYDGPAVSRTLVHVNGQLLSAMPPLHAPLEEVVIRTTQASVRCVPGQPPMRFIDSLVRKFNVCSIPPKICPTSINDPVLRARLDLSRDGLHRTLPWDIWKYNIGSNTGLVDVIRQYCELTNLVDSDKYHVWLVDVNIYSRIYKVTLLTCVNAISTMLW